MQIFTDAGQYVIRFGSSDPSSKTGPARVVEYRIRNFIYIYIYIYIYILFNHFYNLNSAVFDGRYKSWKLPVH
jgi:hypothetical protein